MEENTINLKNNLYSNTNNAFLYEIIVELDQIKNSTNNNSIIIRLGEIINKINYIINENMKNMELIKKDINEMNRKYEELKFNKENMAKSAMMGFTNATDAADYLVKKGMPFRDAHSVIGKLVLYCIDKNCAIDDLPIDELKKFSDIFEDDIYDEISLETCVNKRLTIGAPSPEVMKKVIDTNEKFIASFKI